MEMRYCFPEIPEIYWLNKFEFQCKKCKHVFNILKPNGNEIIKYHEIGGTENRWLPTYGKGGYIYLFEKLFPKFKKNEPIDMKKVNELDKKLREYTEKSSNKNSFTSLYKEDECPKCSSTELIEINCKALIAPQIDWLKISCELIL
jgi:hypothetical protein